MGKDTRERILKEGIALVTANGFNSTGISEILKSASVPKGSFYHYFESKNAFGEQMIRLASEEFLDHLQSFCDRDLPPLDRLRLYLDDKISRMEKSPCRCNCLFGKLSQEVSDDLPGLSQSLAEVFDDWTKRVASLLEEAKERGELKLSAPADALAGFMLSGWEGAVLLSRVRGDLSPLYDYRQILFSSLTGES